MPKQQLLVVFGLIQVFTAILLNACLPISSFSIAPSSKQNQNIQNPLQLTIELQTTPTKPNISQQELAAVKQVITNRLGNLGVRESQLQGVGKNQILVTIPQQKNLDQILQVLGSSAQLEFRAQKPGTELQMHDLQAKKIELTTKELKLKRTNNQTAIAENLAELAENQQAISALFSSYNPPLTSQYIREAYAAPSQGESWEIMLKFDQKGSELFAALTKELAGTGRGIGIFLDHQLISAPVIPIQYAETGITGGSAVISGNFTAQAAQELSIQLQSGALPVPVKITSVTNGAAIKTR